jgi:hypothetical protein
MRKGLLRKRCAAPVLIGFLVLRGAMDANDALGFA